MDIIMLVGSAAVLFLVARSGRKISRLEGLTMLLMFAVYYGFLIYGAFAL